MSIDFTGAIANQVETAKNRGQLLMALPLPIRKRHTRKIIHPDLHHHRIVREFSYKGSYVESFQEHQSYEPWGLFQDIIHENIPKCVVGIYDESNDEYISYVMLYQNSNYCATYDKKNSYSGFLGLWTKPIYRKKGYTAFCLKELDKWAINNGLDRSNVYCEDYVMDVISKYTSFNAVERTW